MYQALRRADRLRVRATVTIRIPRPEQSAEVEHAQRRLPEILAEYGPRTGAADDRQASMH